ncbi:hypothetical protein [Falsiroseomonas sp.]|uniref:hypothetical protein n=1 Tax=Falsiroseomonas sp. TaxID=2870721 RepID=UPI003F6E8B4B
MTAGAAQADRPALRGRLPGWGWALVLLALAGLGVAADLAQPVLPAAGLLALGSALALGLSLLAGAAGLWPRLVAAALLGFAGLALAQQLAGGPRGLLGRHMPALAAWQDELLQTEPPPPWEADRLRAALAAPGAQPRPAPASADEFLFNALLLDARGDRAGAAAALAESLRRAPRPRPDALLLLEALRGWPQSRGLLAEVPLPPEAAALLEARAMADPQARVAALEALPDEQAGPEGLLGLAALAQARIAAALLEGPTIATAARIAAAVEAFADEARFAAFAAGFLDPSRALRLREGIEALGWTREVAARRLAVTPLVPPAGQPGLPMLLRLDLPEAAQAVQIRQGEAWLPLPQEPLDAQPMLRMPRPFQPQGLELRYLDREGRPSEPLAYAFDPVAILRRQAQRALQRQGPFALYQPGWTAPGQLNPLPIAGAFRAGLEAVEWRTDEEATPRLVPVGVPDAALLEGDPPRILVEFATPPETARLLVLTPIYADGEVGEPVPLPIR